MVVTVMMPVMMTMVASMVTPAMARVVVVVAGTAYECHNKGNNGKFLHTRPLYHIL